MQLALRVPCPMHLKIRGCKCSNLLTCNHSRYQSWQLTLTKCCQLTLTRSMDDAQSASPSRAHRRISRGHRRAQTVDSALCKSFYIRLLLMQESSSATNVARSTPPERQRLTAAATVLILGMTSLKSPLSRWPLCRSLECGTWHTGVHLHSIFAEDDEMEQHGHLFRKFNSTESGRS